jgi:hypothetical protein
MDPACPVSFLIPSGTQHFKMAQEGAAIDLWLRRLLVLVAMGRLVPAI